MQTTTLYEPTLQILRSLEEGIIKNRPPTLTIVKGELLDRCIRNAALFLSNQYVQDLVEQDFNNKNYRRLDPSFGDDGCQARPLILQQMIRGNPGATYAALKPEDQLFVTLCHVLTYYLSDVVDHFDMLLYEKRSIEEIERPYGSPNARAKVGRNNRDNTVWILSYCLAHSSVTRLYALRDHYAQRIPALGALFQKQFQHNGLPQLSTQESTQLLFLDALLNENPILLHVKIIRRDSTDQYTLGGHVSLLYLPNPQAAASFEEMLDASFRVATKEEARHYASTPMVTILCQALLTEKEQTLSLGEYANILRHAKLPLLISALSLGDDQSKGRKAGTEVLFPQANAMCKTLPPLSYYASNSTKEKHKSPTFDRTDKLIPFCPVHLVMSTLENEQEKAASLEEKCAGYKEGTRITTRYHMGVALAEPSLPGGQPVAAVGTSKGIIGQSQML